MSTLSSPADPTAMVLDQPSRGTSSLGTSLRVRVVRRDDRALASDNLLLVYPSWTSAKRSRVDGSLPATLTVDLGLAFAVNQASWQQLVRPDTLELQAGADARSARLPEEYYDLPLPSDSDMHEAFLAELNITPSTGGLPHLRHDDWERFLERVGGPIGDSITSRLPVISGSTKVRICRYGEMETLLGTGLCQSRNFGVNYNNRAHRAHPKDRTSRLSRDEQMSIGLTVVGRMERRVIFDPTATRGSSSVGGLGRIESAKGGGAQHLHHSDPVEAPNRPCSVRIVLQGSLIESEGVMLEGLGPAREQITPGDDAGKIRRGQIPTSPFYAPPTSALSGRDKSYPSTQPDRVPDSQGLPDGTHSRPTMTSTARSQLPILQITRAGKPTVSDRGHGGRPDTHVLSRTFWPPSQEPLGTFERRGAGDQSNTGQHLAREAVTATSGAPKRPLEPDTQASDQRLKEWVKARARRPNSDNGSTTVLPASTPEATNESFGDRGRQTSMNTQGETRSESKRARRSASPYPRRISNSETPGMGDSWLSPDEHARPSFTGHLQPPVSNQRRTHSQPRPADSGNYFPVSVPPIVTVQQPCADGTINPRMTQHGGPSYHQASREMTELPGSSEQGFQEEMTVDEFCDFALKHMSAGGNPPSR